MKEVKILWTGGWDSTFRIIELSRQKIIVQPIYVYSNYRNSCDREIKAMEEILNKLNEKKETKALIKPLIIINRDDIPEDEEISIAYEVLHKKTNIGYQYMYLARVAKMFPGIEVGVELADANVSGIILAIKEAGALIFNNGIGELDKKESSKEAILLFGNFKFPIITKTEKDMVKIIKKWKYEDVIKHIWFCHNPINEEPCGFCHPCILKMRSDMEFLLPKNAQKRYKKYHFLEKICGHKNTDKLFNVYVKIRKIINRREK